MADLDIVALKNGLESLEIGRLTKEVIDLLGLNHQECKIIFWKDRLSHIEKHKGDFKSEDDFYKHIIKIPEIIENPDYVGKHPTKGSIEYIKRLDQLIIVAVRIKAIGNLAFRSAYPLTEKQLEDYLRSGTLIKFVKPVDIKE